MTLVKDVPLDALNDFSLEDTYTAYRSLWRFLPLLAFVPEMQSMFEADLKSFRCPDTEKNDLALIYQLNKKIRSKKLIETYPIFALSTSNAFQGNIAVKFAMWQAITVACCVRLQFLESEIEDSEKSELLKQRIKVAARPIRLVAQTSNFSTAKILGSPPRELLGIVNFIENRVTSGELDYNRFIGLVSALRIYSDVTAMHTKSRTPQFDSGFNRADPEVLGINDCDREVTITRIFSAPQFVSADDYAKFDPPDPPLLDIKTAVDSRPYSIFSPVRRIAVQNVADYYARRQMALPCQWQTLTGFEARWVFESCVTHLKDRRLSIAALYVALSLVTGRKIGRLQRLANPHEGGGGEKWVISNERVRLANAVDLPKHRFSTLGKALLSPGNNQSAFQAIPAQLENVLVRHLRYFAQHGFDDSNFDDSIRTVIRNISRGLSRPVTKGRISDWLYGSMRMAGIDQAVASWIIGQPATDAPQLYYTQFKSQSLATQYERHLQSALGIIWPRERLDSDVTGSIVQASDRAVSALFEAMRQNLRWRPSSRAEQIIYHRDIVLYTYHVLILATGHRPIRSPFEKITDFDLQAGFVWVSDKENRNTLSARLVPLCQVATMQVRFYLEHLRSMVATGATRKDELYSRSLAATSGASSLFFFIDDSGRSIELGPGLLTKSLAATWPLPNNWHRHYLRSKLTGRLHGHIIDTLMGHATFGCEPFSQDSSLSMSDLALLKSNIQKIFDELGIKALSMGKNA